MAGLATPARATAVATNVSTEGLALFLPYSGGDVLNPSLANIPPGVPGNANNEVHGVLNITAGAGTTAVVVTCRRGNGTGGAIVGVAESHTLAAGASANIAFKFRDLSAPLQVTYSINVTQTGGTGAGTVNDITGQVGSFI